jgi:hypothetical protein
MGVFIFTLFFIGMWACFFKNKVIKVSIDEIRVPQIARKLMKSYSSWSGSLIKPIYPLQAGQYNSIAWVSISSSWLTSVPFPCQSHFEQLTFRERSTVGE